MADTAGRTPEAAPTEPKTATAPPAIDTKPLSRPITNQNNNNKQPNNNTRHGNAMMNGGSAMAPAGTPTMRDMRKMVAQPTGQEEMMGMWSSTETLAMQETGEDPMRGSPRQISTPSAHSPASYAPTPFGYVLQPAPVLPPQIPTLGLLPQQQYQYPVQTPVYVQTQNGMQQYQDGFAEGMYGQQGQVQVQGYRRYPGQQGMVQGGMGMGMGMGQMSRQATLVDFNGIPTVDPHRPRQPTTRSPVVGNAWQQGYNGTMTAQAQGYGMGQVAGQFGGIVAQNAGRSAFAGDARRGGDAGQQERRQRRNHVGTTNAIQAPTPTPPPQQQQQQSGGTCRYFRQGHCKYEDKCRYSHDLSRPSSSSNNNNNVYGNYQSYPGMMYPSVQMQYGVQYGGGYQQGGYAHQAGGQNGGGQHGQQSQGQGQQQHRRREHGKSRQASEEARFINAEVEQFVGEIPALCKDQYGCRFLQRKLEDGAGRDRELIFTEVYSHYNELMTDPFGNYLCQKMIEVATDEQKSVIVGTVAQEIVNISLNLHGTRAVQKLIENLSLPTHVQIVVESMNANVVTLIKDLNGNHVIQKCLKTLSHENNEFIFRAVTEHCMEVASHKHGCCVLQRCLDDSSEKQKMKLITEITYHALPLVQDPFGNYVVQYVLDLAEARFTTPLIRQFLNNVGVLSMQKHSSNAIEKSIKIADAELRALLIAELLKPETFETLVRDQYANFVVQTALDHAEPFQRLQLVELITPLLPAMRGTPFGKRILSRFPSDFPVIDTVFPGFQPPAALAMPTGTFY